jgi:hypothetical protein
MFQTRGFHIDDGCHPRRRVFRRRRS